MRGRNVLVALGLAAFTTIGAADARAQAVTVQGSGSGALEAPPVPNGGVAYASCTFDRDAQTISCTSRVYNIVDLTAGHLHVAGPGSSGPVIVPIPNLPLHISGAFGQSWTWSASDVIGHPEIGIGRLDDLFQACAAGNCYLNWHTTASPGGSLRVNLCPTSKGANTINSIAVCTNPS